MLQHVNIRPFVTGAVQPKLSQRNLKSVPLHIAGQKLYRAYADLIGPTFATIRANTQESVTLSALRDALLPRLVSGKLRVAETNIVEPV